MLIRTFTISNFRTFEYLQLGDLERVNLVAGMNNVGKTALLEALLQFSTPNLPRAGLRLNELRGIREPGSEDLSFHLFHRYDTSVPVELIADGDWGPVPRSLRIKLRPRAASRIALGEDDDSSEHLVLDDFPDEIVFQYVDETGEYESTGLARASKDWPRPMANEAFLKLTLSTAFDTESVTKPVLQCALSEHVTSGCR